MLLHYVTFKASRHTERRELVINFPFCDSSPIEFEVFLAKIDKKSDSKTNLCYVSD